MEPSDRTGQSMQFSWLQVTWYGWGFWCVVLSTASDSSLIKMYTNTWHYNDRALGILFPSISADLQPTDVLGSYHGVFSSLERILGNYLTIHSLPVFSSSEVEISSHKLIPLSMQGSVHSGSTSWDNCGWMFPDKLPVSSFLDRSPHHAWTVA